mgnify:CR=1 FL=1
MRSLRDQDPRREADPHWYRRRDLLGMMLYVDAFAGNLKGVEAKLPYIQECGVNYLHLMRDVFLVISYSPSDVIGRINQLC